MVKSFKTLAVVVGILAMASARQNAPFRRMDVEARHHGIAMERRAPIPILGIPDLGNNDPNNVSTTPTSTDTGNGNGDGNGNGNTGTSTTSGPVFGDGPSENLPSTTSTTTPPNNNNNNPTTSTTPPVVQTTPTTTTPLTTATTSTSAAAGNSVTVATRVTQDNYQGTTLYAGTGNLSGLRASQTATSSDTNDSAASTSNNTPFMQNKTAVAATFTILGIVAVGGLVFVGFWFYKKSQRGKLGEEDMWDEASMKEFHGPPPGMAISAPSAAVLNDTFGAGAAGMGGLGRKNTVLPSQSAGAAPLTRTRSNNSPPRREIETDEEPDEILALPPVTNFERPRDSAYDIVPAAPPVAAYASQSQSNQYGYNQAYSGGGYGGNAYASGSGAAAGSSGLQPPKKKGDHSSFGSGLGNDPFAGSGFTNATRESTYGPGQAGRGAGYNMNASGSQEGHVGAGNQWPQGYNPYTGYSQGERGPYGPGGYGYAQ